MSILAKYTSYDEKEFKAQLHREMQELTRWFNQGVFSNEGLSIGCELEFNLVDQDNRPAKCNLAYLKSLNSKYVVPEVYASVAEINSDYFQLQNNIFSKLHAHLSELWAMCYQHAKKNNITPIAIGLLPTFEKTDLNINDITAACRYQMMNEKLWQGKSHDFAINGKDNLKCTTNNMSLMGTSTAFHLHLQVPAQQSSHYYNASQILSAPLLAMSTNSPFLLGKDLWHETRIDFFEKLINATSVFPRVGLGDKYITHSFLELFHANMQQSVLLPYLSNSQTNQLQHLILHNSTVWRWNRPVIGFNDSGQPHLRIEHRALPTNPSLIDMVANTAFFVGLIHELMHIISSHKKYIPFHEVKSNFYLAAKNGLSAEITWFDNKKIPVADLIEKQLLSIAEKGLKKLSIKEDDIKKYLSVIEERVKTRRTGSHWQREFMQGQDASFSELVKLYIKYQGKDTPIAQWNKFK